LISVTRKSRSVALPAHGERQVFEVGRFAGERPVDERADVGPDLRPDVVEATAERRRVLGAQELGIGLVVEEAEFRPPGDEHREFGVEHQADHAAE
jgi:hypothetical protein